MRKSLEQLIEVAYSVKLYFCVGSFELHMYEDGSYVDFHVSAINDAAELLKRTQRLMVKILFDDRGLIVRLFENYNE